MAEPSIRQRGKLPSSHSDRGYNVPASGSGRDRTVARVTQIVSDQSAPADFCSNSGEATSNTRCEPALVAVLNEIAHEAHLIGTAIGAAILLVQGEAPVCIASSGSTAQEVSAYISHSSDIRKADKPQLCQDVQRDSRFDAGATKRLGLRSFIVLPVCDRNNAVVAMLLVFSSQPQAFDHRDLLLVKSLGRRVGDHMDFADQTLDRKTEVSDTAAASVPPLKAPVSRRQLWFGRCQLPWTRNSCDLLLGVSIVLVAVLLGWALGRSAGESASNRAALHSDASAGNAESADSRSNANSPEVLSDQLASTGGGFSPTRSKLNLTKDDLLSDDSVHESRTNSNHPDSTLRRKSSADDLVIFEKGKQIFPPDQSSNTKEQNPSELRDRRSTVRVSEEVADERLLTRVEPDYPESARKERLQGTVVLDVRVDSRGAVKGLSRVSGDPQLSLLAAAAVRQWKFLPLVRNGSPVSFESQVTLSFAVP